jgi:hypothetical protein
MTLAGLEPLETATTWSPWLIAAVPYDQTGYARRLANARASRDAKAGKMPAFYLVWDPRILDPNGFERLVEALGGSTGRRLGGVGVIRIETDDPDAV